MKFNEAYIVNEAVKPVNGGKGVLILDIDDTLLKADGSVIKIWKKVNGKEIPLSTEEFAKDPDKEKLGKAGYDYREFRDPEKVYASIVNGTPMLKNLKLMDAHVRANWDIVFLTARGLQSVVAKALGDFLKFRDKDGALKPIGDNLKIGLSKAVNDDDFVKLYPDLTDGEKKAMILKQLCSQYKVAKFVDDDYRNIEAAKALKIPNLQVITAHK